MTKNPAGTTSQPQRRGEAKNEANKISITPEGVNIASHMVMPTHGGEHPDPATEETYSAPIGQTAVLIKAIEEALQDERRRIAGLQAHYETLAIKYGKLCKSLDSAAADLIQQFTGIMSDLEADVSPAGSLPDDASEPIEPSDLDAAQMSRTA